MTFLKQSLGHLVIGALRAPGSFCNQAPDKVYCIADKSVSPARNPAKQACETAVRGGALVFNMTARFSKIVETRNVNH